MNLLLDTHAFIWLNNSPEKLSPPVRLRCEQGTDRFFFSLVSAWEMQIKQQLGKLHLQPIAAKIIEANLAENNIALLSITLDHIQYLNRLPLRHRDPFDRLLIAQAAIEGMTLVSADRVFEEYEIDVFW